MKAIQITAFGGPESMHLVDLAEPVPGPGQELIEVTSIGINYADTHQTENSYLSPQKLPLIPGIEVVGIANGRRVLAPVDGGGYAQKALAHSAAMIEIPNGVSDEQALCMLVQGSTAWHILKTVGHLQKGESVVIHAAAGGFGTNPKILIAVTDLPEPDSPTIPSVFPFSKEKESPSTAFTKPSSVGKLTERFLTSKKLLILILLLDPGLNKPDRPQYLQ